MSPSSLIFLVVIAVWAVYLTLHVIRRREHLITARNVDRFSVHIRVLQRRAVRNAPRTRLKSSVTLVRAAQQRRAMGVTTAVADPASGVSDSKAQPPATTVIDAHDTPQPAVAPPVLEHRTQVTASVSDNDTLHIAPIQITWPFAVLGSLASVPPRLLRAGALGASFAFAVLAALLAAAGAIASWLVLFGLVPLGVVVGWLPHSAKAERAARARQMRARRHARARMGADGASTATWQELPGRSRTPEMPVALEHVAAPSKSRSDHPVAPRQPAAVAAAGSAEPPDASGGASAARRSEPFDLLTADPSWSPVPVPPPTYTLKAQARRPMPQPIVGEVPVPIEVDDEFDNWAQARPPRRAVNG